MKSGNLRKLAVLALFLAAAVSLSVAQEDDTRLRAVHMSPGASDISVFLDGERYSRRIGFGVATGYRTLDTGSSTVELISEGDSLLTRTLDLDEGDYTLVIRDRSFNPGTTLIRDFGDSAPSDRSRVRIAHFSPDVLNVDVSLSDGSTFNVNDLSYRGVSRYRSLRPGSNYTLTVEDASTGRQLLEQDLRLRRGRTSTLFISGLLRQSPRLGVRGITEATRDTDGSNGGGDDDGGEDWVTIRRGDYRFECRVIDLSEN